MQLQDRTLLLLAVVMAVVSMVSAHSGTMHSASHNDTSVKISAGSCSNWVDLPATSPTKATASKLSGTGRHLLAAIDATGSARMTVKLDDNCTGEYTTSVLINVTITDGSKPLAGVNISGSVNTGKCSAGGGSVFLLDPTENATDHNKLFFKPVETAEDGRIVGSFANDGVVRVSGNGSAESIVLYRDGDAILCCELIATAPAGGFEAALAPAGKNCTASEEGANQLGMLMDGKWMPCTEMINGSYWMQHGNEYAMCLDYRNGTKASADTGAAGQVGMFMDGVWKPCKLYINGSYYMMHDTTYARCSEYRNGTTVTLATSGGATPSGAAPSNSTKSAAAIAAGSSWLVMLLLAAVAVLAL